MAPLLLIVEVELADDAVEQVHVHEDDEPRALAQAFVKAHSLDAGFGDQLAAQIQAQVDDERARLRARRLAAGAAAPARAAGAAQSDADGEAMYNRLKGGEAKLLKLKEKLFSTSAKKGKTTKLMRQSARALRLVNHQEEMRSRIE